MSGSLPQGWVETTIGAVTTSPAQRQPNVDETFVYIDISSIDRDTKRIENPQQLNGRDAPSRARKVVAAGDVLVSMTRPNLNAVALVPAELDGQIASTGFDVLRPNGVDSRWLFYIVRSVDFVTAMTDLVQGALYPAVKSSDVRSYRIQLPPLAEQQRIADKLDALLARVDACRARLGRVPALLKRFRQAVLAAAVSGRLTEDWRGENDTHLSAIEVEPLVEYGENLLAELPDTWCWRRFRNVATIDSNLVDPNDYTNMPHIAPNHIESNTGRLLPHGTVASDGVKSANHLFRPGHILYSKIRPYLCKAVVVDFSGLCSADMYPISGQLVSNQFLHIWMISPKFTEYASSHQGRTVLPKINQEALNKIPVPVPPVAEQHEIVRRVETLFACADQLDARLAAARTRVEQLTPSVLAKAFRGELVNGE